MQHFIEARMSNGDTIRTSFNGAASEAMLYYIGRTFNLGVEDDKLVYGCELVIDGIRYNPSTHKYISERAHEKNLDLIAAREVARGLRGAPLVGDFLVLNGVYLRFTHDWHDGGLQTTCLRLGDATHNGGFHLSKNGLASYSGALDPMVKKSRFELSGEKRKGAFWMFSEDYVTAHNGINFMSECKVYTMKEEA